MTLAFPKPSQVRQKHEAVRVYPDGREVCQFSCKAGKDEYRRRKVEMWHRQNGLCSLCGLYLKITELTFEHSDGRGFRGGYRDDRIEKDGKPYNSVAHESCNVEKGSRRLAQF